MSAMDRPTHALPENHAHDPSSYVPPKQDPQVVKVLNLLRPKVPAFDRRFPQVNATRACWANYTDFHRCTKKLGEGADTCKWYEEQYKFMCPTEWVERFDEQREEGRFPLKI
ncbi:cytochrome c oxidase subunit 6B1-like [Sycon ciliatum]|uniref:cytochrome c oxidase subunit 6B1-like n=1 Tax=Sycon ciliatum TaxID=27933 RepID=UPI0020AABA0B|eukprot:scpid97881/ scgid17958/ Cytochrome c oxidase subunit 6B1; Cytochrome c oxidase subunit VIb isoform 1; Cytochrome c oxidase subunit 6B1; Cytochrome c oxidase subunit VIb isoform 1